MGRIGKWVAIAALVAASSAAAYQGGAAKRAAYADDVYGFSIDAPRYPGAAPTTGGVVFIAYGPDKGGFAPNLNVSVQPTATTLKDYDELSTGQFKRIGLKLNARRERKVSGWDAVEYDYEGELRPGQKLRFLSLAVVQPDRVVLATHTIPADAFPGMEAEFRASLASFRLKDARPQ